jgi:ferric-dicitrate binding protein FerR (iron transport regulator)
MKNLDPQELITRGAKGGLNRAQREELDRLLQKHPELREAWQLESSLEEALAALPDAPVPSNFTSLVVHQALREKGKAPRRSWFTLPFPRLVASAAITLLIGLTLFRQNRVAHHREMAETVSEFNQVTLALGSDDAPELFANFDAIQRLNLPAESELDLELLAALQQ